MIYVVMYAYLIIKLLSINTFSIWIWFEVIQAFWMMGSNNVVTNLAETGCNLLLFIGLYVLITISHMMEEEIK